MRRLALVIALAILAAACSSTSGDATGDAVESTSGVQTGADGAPDAADGDGEASNQPTDFDYSIVNYDADPVASALRSDRGNAAFPPPVVDPSDIVSGGPGPDGIPPIDDPEFLDVGDVTFLQNDDEGVVVLEINGDARAYPIQILIWHEIVNDEVGGVPVSVTYCPLCNSALVFDRRLGDRVLDFGTSGELYQSALVMFDRQTESLWAHFTGQGLVGHYAGAELTLIPAQTTGFGTFRDAFPDGRVLSPNTGHNRPYGENPYVGYDDETTNPISPFISQPIDDQFAAKARVLGIIDDQGAVGYLLEDVAAAGVVPVTEGGRNLVAFHTGGLASPLEQSGIGDGRDVGQTGVYVAAAADGTELTFTKDGSTFIDAETGSTWDILGRATAGPLEGEQLAGVPHLDTFWFSWSTYQPDQVLIDL